MSEQTKSNPDLLALAKTSNKNLESVLDHIEKLEDEDLEFTICSACGYVLSKEGVKVFSAKMNPAETLIREMWVPFPRLYVTFDYQGYLFCRWYYIENIIPLKFMDTITPEQAWRIVKEENFRPHRDDVTFRGWP